MAVALPADLPRSVPLLLASGASVALHSRERAAFDRLARLTGAHVVAYDLRQPGRGLPLCAVAVQAHLALDRITALQEAERAFEPWIALVAYARPSELRLPIDDLVRAASAWDKPG